MKPIGHINTNRAKPEVQLPKDFFTIDKLGIFLNGDSYSNGSKRVRFQNIAPIQLNRQDLPNLYESPKNLLCHFKHEPAIFFLHIANKTNIWIYIHEISYPVDGNDPMYCFIIARGVEAKWIDIYFGDTLETCSKLSRVFELLKTIVQPTKGMRRAYISTMKYLDSTYDCYIK